MAHKSAPTLTFPPMVILFTIWNPRNSQIGLFYDENKRYMDVIRFPSHRKQSVRYPIGRTTSNVCRDNAVLERLSSRIITWRRATRRIYKNWVILLNRNELRGLKIKRKRRCKSRSYILNCLN